MNNTTTTCIDTNTKKYETAIKFQEVENAVFCRLLNQLTKTRKANTYLLLECEATTAPLQPYTKIQHPASHVFVTDPAGG